ncbi:MAG: guanylate kinase [Deltaproteobacteria bacterium]|nr:guanylate kinase [Deltaproteobacteria bacterium]MBI2974242.1 guanylate kinase [Deltaproteobacteria bacterium]
MKGKGRLIIIASPSGGGKTSIIKHLLNKYPSMVHSISCTTRPARDGEKDGRYYHHIDKKAFEGGMKSGKFAEWALVHDNFYGTPKEPLDNWLLAAKDVLLDLDIVGSLNLKKLYGNRAITIFLLPPSMEELKKRLESRKTDSVEARNLRLKNAIAELSKKDMFDRQVVNDVLEQTYREVEKIIGYADS